MISNVKIVIHIPHASLRMPSIIHKYRVCNRKTLKETAVFMADLYVDKLIHDYKTVKFSYSRLFCDVERFRSDKLESMSKKGMGCVYKRDCFGNDITNYPLEYKNFVLKNYYDKHHKRLDTIVDKILSKFDKCLIIDLHSYSDELVNTIFNVDSNDYPDICIGFNENYCDMHIVSFIKECFKKFGYSVKYNYPYQGSIINNKALKNKDTRVYSIMIEINKRIYLKENEIDVIKFEKLKDSLGQILKDLEEFL